jgi:TP901 family phage tail tape measure protein
MADKTTALKILIETEVQKALKDMGLVDQSIDDLASSITGLNSDLGKTETATEAVAKDIDALGEEAKKASTAIDDFATLGGRSIADLRKEQEKARDAFKRLEASGEHSLEEITRAAKLLDKALDDLEDEIKDVDRAAKDIDGDGFRDLFKQIGAVTAAAAGLQQAIAAVGEYAEFEDDLLAVKALAGASAEEFDRLKLSALDLAGAAGGPKAIAAAMSELAASGSNVDEILGSVDIVGKLSGASRGALDFKSSGDLLTNTVKQLGIGMDSAGEVADRLAKGWNSAGHDGSELGNALAEVLPIVTSLYGHMGDTAPLEKSVAVINVLAETYKKGGAAGTAFNGILASLIKPVGEGAEVLDKYKEKIKVFDDTGRLRDFADIVEDIGLSGMTSSEQIAVFGREAGPAMTALLGAGSQAIRDMEAQLKSADGTVGKTSDTLQEGLGGSLREATAEIEKARLAAVEDFLPALEGVLSLAKYADNAVAGLSGTIKTGAAVWSTAAGGITRYLSYLEDVTDYIGVTDDATNSLRITSDAFLDSAEDLGQKASSSFKKAKGEIDPLAESQKQLASSTAALNQEYAKISRATGVTITSMEELDAAVVSGAIRQDEATGDWIGSEKEKQNAINDTAMAAQLVADEVEKAGKEGAKAAKAAKKEWRDLGKEIDKISEEISDRTSSLEADLNAMARSGMSAAKAQKAIKKEAEAATKSARELAKAGNYEGAIKSADAAKEAWKDVAGNVRRAREELKSSKTDLKEARKEYKELKKEARKDGIIDKDEKKKLKEARDGVKKLKKEVKENGTALKDEKKALKEAMAGVKEAGELGIEILEKQKEAAEANRQALDEAFDFTKAEESVQKLIDEKINKVGPALADGMKDGVDSAVADAERLSAALDDAAKDRTATITIKEVQAAFHGGQIWGPNMSAGAIVNGPRSHDSVKAILAGGEAVTRNSVVSELGYGHFHTLNTRQYDKALKNLAAFHGPASTREILSAYLSPPKLDTPILSLSHAQQNTSAQNFPVLGTIIVQNDKTGEKFPIHAKPNDAGKVAKLIQQNAIDTWHGGGRKGPRPGSY